MRTAIISLGFAKLADANLVRKVDSIIDNMTDNENFPTPSPEISVVKTAAGAFQEALALAVGGGILKTAEKNAAREMLLSLLRNLALYVQQYCKDDLAILLSSGFDARKSPAPVGTLPAPVGATLVNSPLSGVLDFRAKPVPNASAYEGQRTTDVNKDDAWENVGVFTSARFTLADLKPGTIHWARSRAVGSAGPGAWSDAVSAMVT